MTPEWGHFALVLAWVFALYQVGLAVAAAWKKNQTIMMLAPASVYGQAFFLLIAYALLTYAFLVHDFSVRYVASHAHTLLPWPYRISAVWGAHEGSILLWVMLLSVWSAAFIFFSAKKIPLRIQANMIGILGLLSLGFLTFLIFTSNPFLRLLPQIPTEGLGLNPLLQDPGLAIHPPMLYMGYVGFAVTFAVAMAALLEGQFDAKWVRWLKPWVLLAWAFLTFGITLGSWWAYRVLGWGGWWFWDPVENAALLPWLTATALLHSLVLVEKRHTFKVWALLLAILTFCLSLLGTFLVRSGVLISVHAFANDPLRGSFLLKFLMAVVGSALLLFAWRSPILRSERGFQFLSKETFLLMNNIILFVLTLSVLFGTLYPLFLDALNLGKISVGSPYFNFIFIPLILPLMLLMSVGPFCQWQKTKNHRVWQALRWPLAVSVVLTVIMMFFLKISSGERVVGLFVAIFLMGSTMVWYGQHRRCLGMSLAHMGVGVCAIGVIFSTLLQAQSEIRITPGEVATLQGYQFKFLGVREVQGENYAAVVGDFSVFWHQKAVDRLSPEKRRYVSSPSLMSQAAISTNLFRDLYVVLGAPLDKEAWAVRIYVKPFVRFIWLGGVMMLLGGLLSWWSRVRKP